MLLACGPEAWGQSDSTTSTHRLDATVVVAHRVATGLRASTAAVSVITRADIERLRPRSLPDALGLIPGLLFTSRDGGGSLPVAIVRGFFGGGENEYVLLLVDGIPVNTSRTSLAEWTSVPVAAIERIEVVRGSGSVLHGDVAIGGVINVITRAATANALRTTLGVDERGAWDAALGVTRTRGGAWGYTGTASYAAGEGSRAHSVSRRVAASTSVQKAVAPGRTRIALQYDRLEDEDPGPLEKRAADDDPSHANAAFHSDQRSRDAAELSAIVARPLGASRMGHLALRVHGARQGRTRTLLLTPSIGDTQFHHETDDGVWMRGQHDWSGTRAKVATGVEAGHVRYRSSYRDPETSEELSSSSGRRLALSVYTELQRELVARLRAYAGARYDRVTPAATMDSRDEEATFSATSGRLGINYAYREGAADAGNVFLVGSTGFKTPTLDQLYDGRRTRLPDGNTISISNPSLQPQRSREIEAGVFQRVPIGGSSIEISLSAYRRHLEDEIDFDLATFRYGNIRRSRHEALEVLTLAHFSRDIEVRSALSAGRAIFRSGENDGRQLKNIPRVTAQTSLSVPVMPNVSVTVTHAATAKTWIDDENTVTLPGLHLFGAGLRVVAGALHGSVRVENIANERRATFGFLLFDPTAGRYVPMVYPLGGRSVRVALSLER